MINELIKTVKAHLYDRVTSPLAGALIISWCLWNYPILITILSSHDPQQKIEFIQTSLINYTRSIWGPLFTSLFFIFIYPFPARFVYWFWRKQKKALRDIKQKIEDEELLSKEESRAIRKEMFTLQIDQDNEIKRKNEEILNLRTLIDERTQELESVRKKKVHIPQKEIDNRDAEISVLRNEINKLKQMFEPPDTPENINKNYDRILRIISSRAETYENDLMRETGLSGNSVKSILLKLLERGHIYKDSNKQEPYYHVTDMGRDYLADNA